MKAKDTLKMTASHWATEQHHPDIVELLLEYGADSTLSAEQSLPAVGGTRDHIWHPSLVCVLCATTVMDEDWP